ncbi:MAG: transglycosylase SLT domain-containing protein [Bacteroidales bacterium]
MKKALVKYIIVISIIVLLILLNAMKSTVYVERDVNFLESDTLKTLVNVKDGIYLKQGHTVGFHFDILKRFARRQKCEINIKPVQNSNPWEELISNNVDILVVDSQNDTIPDQYQADVISSIDLNDYNQVWVVRKSDYDLLQHLNYWLGHYKQTKEYNNLVVKYFRRYRGYSISSSNPVSILSPYDNLIKKYSKSVNWDWRLLAALIFQESKFSMNAQSNRGAHGLMQIKRTTAKHFGIEDIYDPEQNIKAGTLLLKRLQKMYSKEQIDSVNSVRFVLAAYNAGEGRVEDIRKFSAHKGANPNDWNSVIEVIPMMRNSENLPLGLVRFGTFNGIETVNFVNDVLSRYEDYKVLVK